MPVTIATPEDIPALVSLLNTAYRGEASKKGWTTEADMVKGDLRTDEKDMQRLMQQPGTIFLTYTNENNKIEGCVFLQKRNGKMYLGMLSVDPSLQAKGIGKEIMLAAEEYAKQQGCPSIYMRVISVCHELIAWYERKGYYQTGEHQPFEESRFGTASIP
ncbi:MAG: GNAT family N-acetyltransferase, partial [Chitinophagaceae bacterium]|nr:GNAT family N-acetyltransferase [Chitinophagaceae bacterium]